ncbi:hypothetical protein L7F22_061317 [Adiantum nelumboides]|nr:hypothetical protein [Adiantum nelumboides]
MVSFKALHPAQLGAFEVCEAQHALMLSTMENLSNWLAYLSLSLKTLPSLPALLKRRNGGALAARCDYTGSSTNLIMIALTTAMLFAGRFGLAPSANRKATAGLKLEDRPSGLQTKDLASFTGIDTLACGAMGHVIGVGIVLGLRNIGPRAVAFAGAFGGIAASAAVAGNHVFKRANGGELKNQQLEEDEENLENIQANPTPPSPKSPPPGSSLTQRPPPPPASPIAPSSPQQKAPLAKEISTLHPFQAPDVAEVPKQASREEEKDDKAEALE